MCVGDARYDKLLPRFIMWIFQYAFKFLFMATALTHFPLPNQIILAITQCFIRTWLWTDIANWKFASDTTVFDAFASHSPSLKVFTHTFTTFWFSENMRQEGIDEVQNICDLPYHFDLKGDSTLKTCLHDMLSVSEDMDMCIFNGQNTLVLF